MGLIQFKETGRRGVYTFELLLLASDVFFRNELLYELKLESAQMQAAYRVDHVGFNPE